MGLDGVELVMEVEERFRISIPDEDVPRLLTVGDLCEYLGRRAKKTLEAPGLRRTAFVRVREFLGLKFKIPRDAIHPATRWKTVLPPPIRRHVWLALKQEFCTELPPLQWHRLMKSFYAIGFIAGLIGIVLLIVFGSRLNVSGVGEIIAPIFPLIAYLAYHALNRIAIIVPREVRSVGLLADRMARTVELQTREIPDEIDPWIWNQVTEIVSAVLGVPREKLHPTTRFVEDLGMG